jgi:hypothetical protein
MIVLSVGMPRAGSGWHYNLIQDLLLAAGATDSRTIRSQFHLESILTEVNCNIGTLSPRRLGMVAVPAMLGHTFVIKAHAKPTFASALLRRLGLLKITYIYRDPRDAMVSAMDYGRRTLQRGRPNAFSHLTTFEQGLDFILRYVHIWEAWSREPEVLMARYEDLLSDYERQTSILCAHLGVNTALPATQSVLARNRPKQAEGRQGTHFYRGTVGRFRDAFSSEQCDVLERRLGPYLQQMGYVI